MNFYDDAPTWGEDDDRCPSTSNKALPYKPIEVANRRLIRVRDATYRNAVFSGCFLLPEDLEALPLTGWHEVEVVCLWFGHKLKQSYPRFKINMRTAEILLSGTPFTDFRD